MADVQVTTKNASGQTAVLTLDEADDRIAHFRVMARRGELESVDVKKPTAPRPSK